MKKIIVIVAVAIMGLTTNVTAQKYGHLNAQEVLVSVPGYKASAAELERYVNVKKAEITDMEANLKKAVAKFEAEGKALPKNIQEERYKELQEMSNSVQQFSRKAETKIQEKNQALMNPLLQQIQDAIKTVGKDNGFAYIFDISQGVVLYFDGGTDVTKLVVAELQKNAAKSTAPAGIK